MRHPVRAVPFLLPILVAALALFACGDDDGAGPDGDGNDLTPPSLTSVTAVDATHIDVRFSETVTRASAEDLDHYVIVESTTAARAEFAAPGDTLHLSSASLLGDGKTVALTAEDPMQPVAYDFAVRGVTDAAGNTMVNAATTSFTGSTAADVTPPVLVYRSPGPNATNVATAMPIGLQFSEAVTEASFINGFSWTSNAGPVAWTAESDDGGVNVTVRQALPLAPGTKYTVTLDGIQDDAGNTMETMTWSFTTSATQDHTPPTVVSTNPADGETQVDVNSNLSITFSEAVNQIDIEIIVMPGLGDGDMVWTNGGKTLVFDPDLPMLADQQYAVTILPGGVTDLAGNGIAQPFVVRFTTGNQLAQGSLAGTIAGDPLSDDAGDPTGAFAIAATQPPMDTDDFQIGGFDQVAANDTYDIPNLTDGVYYPFAILDSNDDGVYDPSSGDAVGMYGVDIRGFDFSPDSVTIAAGNRITGVNFPLFDSSAITGTVTYQGAYSSGFYNVGVGLFDADNFDPADPPVVGTSAYWPNYTAWSFLTLDGMPDGNYYVGAYLDVNFNDAYDDGIDPSGMYGGETPTLLAVSGGVDRLNLVIALTDPPLQARASRTVAWPEKRASRLPGITRLRVEDVKGWNSARAR